MTLRESFETWLTSQDDPSAALAFIRDEYKTDEETKLAEFAAAARALVPYDIKTHPEEKDGVKTKMVDSFLYPDDVLDDWCDEGEFSRTYCKKYPDEEIESYNFMSDSFSIDELSYLFGSGVLGKTEGKQLLDIGSRFGACIYAASLYSSFKKQIGVELDESMIKIAQKLKVPGEFITADIRKCASKHVPESDVIIMNNVFEYFMEPKEELDCWKTIFEFSKKGQLFVMVPGLEDTFERLEGNLCRNSVIHDITRKVRKVGGDDEKDIHIYVVE
jgi:hypothetical protein